MRNTTLSGRRLPSAGLTDAAIPLPNGRSVLHFDLDNFRSAVEERDDDRLRGHPLIISGNGERGIVRCCNWEARRFGLRPGMPLRIAGQRCPGALVRRGDEEKYLAASGLVTEVIAAAAPVLERAAADQFYLDLTGMDRYLGSWRWAAELRQRVERESGLPLSMGLASSKLVARVGVGGGKPRTETRVPNGRERDFLSPLSVGRLPGTGRKTVRKLAFMGVRRLGTVAALPPEVLVREFGKDGRRVWRHANGIDPSPVLPDRHRDTLSREEVFQPDTIDLRLLYPTLFRLVTLLAFGLRCGERVAGGIRIKIRYTDGNTYQRQRRLRRTASDRELREAAQATFRELFVRRQRVRLLGVTLTGLAPGHHQPNLFDPEPREPELLRAMDHIRRRFGEYSVFRGYVLP